jgi:ribosomal protein L29
MAETKNKTELLKELADKRKALYDFRFAVSGSKIKNIKDGRNIKKEIARILTKIRAQKA